MAFYDKSSINGERLPAEIEGLLASYRTALPVPEPSPEFLPKLWASIDSRPPVFYSVSRFARGFVTVAAGLCLLMSAALWVPPQIPASHNGTYVDILADDAADDGTGDVV